MLARRRSRTLSIFGLKLCLEMKRRAGGFGGIVSRLEINSLSGCWELVAAGRAFSPAAGSDLAIPTCGNSSSFTCNNDSDKQRLGPLTYTPRSARLFHSGPAPESGINSVGRVPASQAGCRGFESRIPLHHKPLYLRAISAFSPPLRGDLMQCAKCQLMHGFSLCRRHRVTVCSGSSGWRGRINFRREPPDIGEARSRTLRVRGGPRA